MFLDLPRVYDKKVRSQSVAVLVNGDGGDVSL